MAGRCHVAVVDDDAPLCRALSRLLRGRGFDAVTYGSAREFLSALPAHRPDCLILDLRMPGMSGLDLLAGLAARDERIPAIVITAFGQEDVVDRCARAGAVAVLAKPVQSAPLFEALARACGARTAH
jgi:FixJ family two-component response regulator